MNCQLCQKPIHPGDEVNLHHPTPKSEGGTLTAPTHRECHVEHHSINGHFRVWGGQGGRLSAITCRWAFNLKNVRQHPAYDFARSFYAATYAH